MALAGATHPPLVRAVSGQNEHFPRRHRAALEQLVTKALDAFKKITILVNNAGGGGRVRLKPE